MTESYLVPFIPETAPFTLEQRAYLNGFFAGLFSRAPLPAGLQARPAAGAVTPLTILFGSQTGNAENLAKRAAKEAGKRGFAPTIHDLANYSSAQLAGEARLLVLTSTYGDGEPPDNARSFWESLSQTAAPRLDKLRFSVLALGDSNYPKFCAFGRDLDARLQALGACSVQPRAECDVEYDEPFAQWLDQALAKLAQAEEGGAGNRVEAGPNSVLSRNLVKEPPPPDHTTPAAQEPRFDRQHPYPAILAVNRRLNGAGSAKETRHLELALEQTGLDYDAGDALGILPSNCPELAAEILNALGFDGTEMVPGKEKQSLPLGEALLTHYEITKIPRSLLQAMAEKSADPLLHQLISPGVNGELSRYLRGREIIDLLLAHRSVRFDAHEFAGLLKKLQPRLYSISSSPKAHPGEVHLTVAVVRYESLGRARKGVCSSFLADRVPLQSSVPVFVQRNAKFRLPARLDAPIIMVGPGTGIAPFRAFLQERRQTAASGKNWLFFGDQHATTDYLYRDEIEAWRKEGHLTRLDLAFSRDQAGKVYVQHRMREQATELFAWLEAGAYFYVCGDASRMAKDVDQALHEVIRTAGARTEEQAAEYVRQLQADKRYQRDVY